VAVPPAGDVVPRGRRWISIVLAVLAGVVIVGVAGWYAGGEKAVRAWQYRRTIVSAEALVPVGDWRGAGLAARQALSLHPGDARALKVMALLAERTGGPEVLVWQQQLCLAEGSAPEEWLRLVRQAMSFGETGIAEAALARTPEAIRQTGPWHELAGALALRSQRWAEAEAQFREALRLNPGNTTAELNLAAVQLASPDSSVAAAARAATERLAGQPESRLNALRNLLADARRRDQADRARQLAAELGAAPGATPEDQLQGAEELRRIEPAAFRVALEGRKNAAGQDASAIASLMRWMNARGLAAETVAWADQLPPALRDQSTVALSLAEALVQAGQWDRLSKLTAEGNWGGLEFLRLAFRARAAAGDGAPIRSASVQAAWQPAVIATQGNYSSLAVLQRLVESWGWKEQATEILWLLASQPSGQRPPLQALFRQYRAAGDTANLYRVARRILEIDPAHPLVKNNVAMLALLLGKDLETAHRQAAELHAAFPKEPGITTTYAFSLLKQGRAAEALPLVEAMPPGADPGLGFYRALVLAAAGRRDEARPALQTALDRQPELLPEEKAFARELLAKP